MYVLLWLALGWLVVASVGAVIGGTAIRLAEERDVADRERWEAGTALRGNPVDLPTPRSPDASDHVPTPL
jgi:hypothetical protein